MFRKNESQQMSIYDKYLNLSKREKHFFEKSWAYIFGNEIFPLIDESMFDVLYCENNGRPNTPANVLMGSLIIKEILDRTDDEMVTDLMFDVRIQYALHTSSYEEQPLSDKSLSNFRNRNYEYTEKTGIDLIANCVKSLSAKIAEFMNITGHTRRMDSMMISANIKKLSRLELIYVCISNLVKYLDKNTDEKLPDSLKHYIEKNDYNQVFYYRKNSESDDLATSLISDAIVLLDICGEKYLDIKEFQLFSRCISEQTVAIENGRRLAEKEDKIMNSEMLQNPSDPDATYREKAGKEHRGYAANFEESVGENGSVITDFQFEKNTYSDSKFLEDRLNSLDAQNEKTVIVTDGAYPSESNIELAEEKNIEIISTNLTGTPTADIYADFEITDNNVVKCPLGNAPVSCSFNNKTGVINAYFSASACENCPHKNECKAKLCVRKNNYKVTVSKAKVNRARTQRKMKTETAGNYAKLRNGAETIPSLLRRKYNVDRMPRGKRRGSLFFSFKIAAINVRKLFDFRMGLGHYAPNPVIV